LRLQRQAALVLSTVDVLVGVVFLWAAAHSSDTQPVHFLWWNPQVILVAAGGLWLLAAVSLLARWGAATHPPLPAAVLVLADMTAVELTHTAESLSAAPLMQSTTAAAIRDHVTAETFLVDGRPGGRGDHTDPGELEAPRDTFNMSIRTAEHKYVFHPQDADELYDMSSDEAEMRNLAGESASSGPLAPRASSCCGKCRPTARTSPT
jgi:hypothetical protein